MREQEIPVTLLPWGKTAHVLPGSRLIEAIAAVGLNLDLPCGGEGTCLKCRVRVAEGAVEPGPTERRAFSPHELDAGFRLACQVTVRGPMCVEIPRTSLLGGGLQDLVDHRAVGCRRDPHRSGGPQMLRRTAPTGPRSRRTRSHAAPASRWADRCLAGHAPRVAAATAGRGSFAARRSRWAVD